MLAVMNNREKEKCEFLFIKKDHQEKQRVNSLSVTVFEHLNKISLIFIE